MKKPQPLKALFKRKSRRLVSSPHKSVTVLKKPYYATWHSAIIIAVTSLTSSNFLSTQSDACFHPIILIVHVADQDFTHEMVIQNSRSLHKFQVMDSSNALGFTGFSSKSSGFISILFQRTQLHWNSLPNHPDLLVFSTHALDFIGILFQVIWIPRNSLPMHLALLAFFSQSSESLKILYQCTRLHWHSFPSHPDPSKFSTNAPGFIGILFPIIQIPQISLPTHSGTFSFSSQSYGSL